MKRKKPETNPETSGDFDERKLANALQYVLMREEILRYMLLTAPSIEPYQEVAGRVTALVMEDPHFLNAAEILHPRTSYADNDYSHQVRQITQGEVQLIMGELTAEHLLRSAERGYQLTELGKQVARETRVRLSSREPGP